MNTFALLFRELVGLFIDDEFLAIAVLAVIAGCAVLDNYVEAHPLVAGPDQPLAVGTALLVGCVAVLLLSVARGSRRKPK